MTTIHLTDEEALSFKAFREHQAIFELLLAHNVFEIRNGSATLHFNAAGQLASIDAHLKIYRQPPLLAVVIEKEASYPQSDTPPMGKTTA